MSTDIQLFEFQNQNVRVVVIDGEPWFVLADLCTVLEISNVGNVASRLDQAGVRQTDIRSGGQMRRVTIVSESGMYEVVFRSDKPEAVSFRRWVTTEVLPQIRKTGTYGVPALDLSDPIAAIEAANTRSQQAIEIAKSERARADKAEQLVQIEQKHRRAIEGGDGILLTDFGKKYFSEVRHTDFFEHLYEKKWLIDQRNTRINAHGEIRDGYDHGKPTYKGRPFIYEHDRGTHGGKRRFQSRVRPQREVELRDSLAAEGLPVNTHSSGLVLISNAELERLA